MSDIDLKKYQEFVDAVTSQESKNNNDFQKGCCPDSCPQPGKISDFINNELLFFFGIFKSKV